MQIMYVFGWIFTQYFAMLVYSQVSDPDRNENVSQFTSIEH
jgi:hypothetical protein